MKIRKIKKIIDKGPCFLMRNLSYRRRFIRTIWSTVFIILMLILLSYKILASITVILTCSSIIYSTIQLIYYYKKSKNNCEPTYKSEFLWAVWSTIYIILVLILLYYIVSTSIIVILACASMICGVTASIYYYRKWKD